MAEDVRHFTVTTPAGSGSPAVTVTPIGFPPRIVRQVDWRVPSGPMGTMGFLLAMGAVPVLPVYGQSVYVIADGEHGTWTPSDYPDSGGWAVWAYNSGVNPHAVNLTFHLDVPARAIVPSAPLPLSQLQAAPDLSESGPPVARRP